MIGGDGDCSGGGGGGGGGGGYYLVPVEKCGIRNYVLRKMKERKKN